jgi:hypothetical protein
MPASQTDHLRTRIHQDPTDISADISADISEVTTCKTRKIGSNTIQHANGKRHASSFNVASQETPEAASHSPQRPVDSHCANSYCIDSLRASLLDARLALLEYSLDLVKPRHGGRSHALQHLHPGQHVHPARVMRLEQHMTYLEQLQATAQYIPAPNTEDERTQPSNLSQAIHHSDDGVFEACQHALENALCVLERVPHPSYMVDLNEVVWQILTNMVATQCVETGITVTLPIILGHPQVLTWLMTELLAGSALECLQVATTCKHTTKPLLTVDYLDTVNNWRLNVSVSHLTCTPAQDAVTTYMRPSLSYIKQASALLEGDFWVEAVSHEEMTFSLSLPKRLSFT